MELLVNNKKYFVHDITTYKGRIVKLYLKDFSADWKPLLIVDRNNIRLSTEEENELIESFV
jgi:hypothetical protein